MGKEIKTTAQQAYEALNTLIDYAYSKESDILPPIIHTNDLMNRLKPFVEIMRNELEWKVLKNHLYAHIWMEECYSCWHKSIYWYKAYCEWCWKKNIMNAGGKIDYSLIYKL